MSEYYFLTDHVKWFSLIANIICPQWCKRLGPPQNNSCRVRNIRPKTEMIIKISHQSFESVYMVMMSVNMFTLLLLVLKSIIDISWYIFRHFFSSIFFFVKSISQKIFSISFKYNNQLATSIWFFIIHSFIHLINTNNKTKQMYVNIYTRLKSNILPCFLALVEATTERVAPQGSLHIICPIYRSWLCRETLL